MPDFGATRVWIRWMIENKLNIVQIAIGRGLLEKRLLWRRGTPMPRSRPVKRPSEGELAEWGTQQLIDLLDHEC